MKDILIPVALNSDHSAFVEYAISLGKRSGARLTFLFIQTSLISGSRSVDYDPETQSWEAFAKEQPGYGRKIQPVLERLSKSGTNFRLLFRKGLTLSRIVDVARDGNFDLIMIGLAGSFSFSGYWGSTLVSRVLAEVPAPVLSIPMGNPFSEIEHITYAVDLRDYDPNIIRQIKSIAAMFDARLTVVHVNSDPEEKERYRFSLERTISDTLDYPKVYYKFFDYHDPLAGLKKFVGENNTHLLAMINRKKFDWKDAFYGRSLTRKMARDLDLPLLAFHKD